jgi:dipeptidyl aminopeptidase/acylaminoacyl peptidase
LNVAQQPTAVAAASLSVTDQTNFSLDEGLPISLSPNGEWLLANGINEKDLLLYDVDTLNLKQRVPFQSGLVDLRGITWSPDSQRIAFTESLMHNYESDIWVLEVESGKLIDLTDDGATGAVVGGRGQDNKPLIDVMPAWSPDGTELIFARLPGLSGTDETTLYRVKATGGEPEKLFAVARRPLAVHYNIRWSPDGKAVFYSLVSGEANSSDEGIWMAGLDGQNPQHLVSAPDAQGLTRPILVELAPGGIKALIYYEGPAEPGLPANLSRFAIVDVRTGEVEPLKKLQGTNGSTEFFTPHNATFSPDGTRVLYVYPDAQQQPLLAVRDIEGDDEHVLGVQPCEAPCVLAYSRAIGLGLNWGKNDTIYIATFIGPGILLHLSSK